MSNFDQQKDYWKPCRPGTILKAVDLKLQRERRRFLIRSVMGVVVGGAGIFSAVFISTNSSRRRLASLDNDQIFELPMSEKPADENTLVANTLDAPANERKKFTCQDIESNLDRYLVAFRLPVDQRSEEQSGLLTDFDRHLEACRNCLPLVNAALNRDAIG